MVPNIATAARVAAIRESMERFLSFPMTSEPT
jgi:hypothetical protein